VSALPGRPPIEQKEGRVPSLLKSDKIDHDLEFERLLCFASKLQISKRLQPTGGGGLQRPEEFPTLTTSRSLGENPSLRMIE
jgi:hypothetical protein